MVSLWANSNSKGIADSEGLLWYGGATRRTLSDQPELRSPSASDL